MVLKRALWCPTRIHSGGHFRETLWDLLGKRRWTLVTSKGWRTRGIVDALSAGDNAPMKVIDAVPANPTLTDIEALAGPATSDVVVALGGGSVMDAAKGILAVHALRDSPDALRNHLVRGDAMPDGFIPKPLICIPTTSGTGSEITRWGTIWGDEKTKHSLVHPALYPTDAILDPRLCLSMPRELTLSSGLDALSHAMEAIWNVNNTPVSDHLAQHAIGALLVHLPEALEGREDVSLRQQVQLASLFAGLAMGITQTALAHSISYPFTAEHGMPHGFACSFTLPEVARYNLETHALRLNLIAQPFGCDVADLPDRIASWMKARDIGRYVLRYARPEVVEGLGDNVITRTRAANNIRPADAATARSIARRSLELLQDND